MYEAALATKTTENFSLRSIFPYGVERALTFGGETVRSVCVPCTYVGTVHIIGLVYIYHIRGACTSRFCSIHKYACSIPIRVVPAFCRSDDVSSLGAFGNDEDGAGILMRSD